MAKFDELFAVCTSIRANDSDGNAEVIEYQYLPFAMNFVRQMGLRADVYPDWLHGLSRSADGTTEDISSLSTFDFSVAIDGSDYQELAINGAACTTGENTATEIQRAIRAIITDTTDPYYYVFQQATCVWDDTDKHLTISSPSYTEASSVLVGASEDSGMVTYLGFGTYRGGTVTRGSKPNERADTIVVTAVGSMVSAKVTLNANYSGGQGVVIRKTDRLSFPADLLEDVYTLNWKIV